MIKPYPADSCIVGKSASWSWLWRLHELPCYSLTLPSPVQNVFVTVGLIVHFKKTSVFECETFVESNPPNPIILAIISSSVMSAIAAGSIAAGSAFRAKREAMGMNA